MPRIVSNRRQLTRLVELMRQNTDIAKANCTKQGAQIMWEVFTEDLNSLGPPTRDWQKWQRVWTDLKCKIKKKAIETGRSKLHHLEETVVKILELKTHIRPRIPTRNLEPRIPARKPEPDSNSKEAVVIVKQELNEVIDEDPIDINEASDCVVIEAENLQLERRCPSSTEQQQQQSYERMAWSSQQVNDVVTNIKQELDGLRDNTTEPKQRRTPQPESNTSNSAKQQFYDTMTALMGDIKTSVRNMDLCAKKSFLLQRKHNAEILKLKRTKLILYKHNLKLKIDILKHKRQQLNGKS